MAVALVRRERQKESRDRGNDRSSVDESCRRTRCRRSTPQNQLAASASTAPPSDGERRDRQVSQRSCAVRGPKTDAEVLPQLRQARSGPLGIRNTSVSRRPHRDRGLAENPFAGNCSSRPQFLSHAVPMGEALEIRGCKPCYPRPNVAQTEQDTRVLKPKEVRALLAELGEPYKTMVQLCCALGLRACELLALQWGDFDWRARTVLVQRSVVQGEVNPTKTEASQKAIPLGPELVKALRRLKSRTSYPADSDYVFASDTGKPRWQGILLTDHIKPAAIRAGIGKIGWHTFRHTNSTLLHELGAPLAVQKELLRHSDIQTTMNVYTQAVSLTKRRAAEKVQRILLRKKSA